MTGPNASGFEDLSKLKPVSLKTKLNVSGKDEYQIVEIELKNPSSTIAFFVQLQYLDENGCPVRPSFYTDNFFSLLPGESKKVTIETSNKNLPKSGKWVVKGWNVKKKEFNN